MGVHKVVISFTLLLVLGFSVAAQAFGQDSHSPSCSTDQVSEGALAECEHGSLASTSASETHTPQHCHDPCHLGQSHFGHCSALLQSYSMPYLTIDESGLLGTINQNLVKAPELDGPRRPPRLS